MNEVTVTPFVIGFPMRFLRTIRQYWKAWTAVIRNVRTVEFDHERNWEHDDAR